MNHVGTSQQVFVVVHYDDDGEHLGSCSYDQPFGTDYEEVAKLFLETVGGSNGQFIKIAEVGMTTWKKYIITTRATQVML